LDRRCALQRRNISFALSRIAAVCDADLLRLGTDALHVNEWAKASHVPRMREGEAGRAAEEEEKVVAVWRKRSMVEKTW